MRSAVSRLSKTRDDDEADDQHVERGQAAMHQHLVDDDLEEQRRDQGKELQEERGDSTSPSSRRYLSHRLQEPGDVEAAGQLAEARAARHQDEPPAPLRPQIRRGSAIAGGRRRGRG